MKSKKMAMELLIHKYNMVHIPAGSFIMGSPANEPGRKDNEVQHKVVLSKDFYMGRYPVTNAQYGEFLNANAVDSKGISGVVTYPKERLISADSWGLKWETDKWVVLTAGYENHPVTAVTWHGAKSFADWAGLSLPTEQQWEYACRGDYPNKATQTATKPFGIGDGTKLYSDMANFDGRSPYSLSRGGMICDYDGNGTHFNAFFGRTIQVGNYPANNYGLYDMHGNVQEWCAECYRNYESGAVRSIDRVLRGGSWMSDARDCRSASRYSTDPDDADDNFGFRVVFNPHN